VASKQLSLPNIGDITLYKRKGSSTIRLSINPKGQVRVTMPYWTSYEAGLKFARSQEAWIIQHTNSRSPDLAQGQSIGKSHRIVFEASPVAEKTTSRISDTIIRITHPANRTISDSEVQLSAEKASIRALRNEAEELLPGRLEQLARFHGFSYRSIQIKQLTGRWGSCDSHKNIVLNLFLMELPWTLIDYVLLHELTHTEILRHGTDFWAAMRRVLPDAQVSRKAMKLRRPVVGSI